MGWSSPQRSAFSMVELSPQLELQPEMLTADR
jgi:hypothetical protein